MSIQLKKTYTPGQLSNLHREYFPYKQTHPEFVKLLRVTPEIYLHYEETAKELYDDGCRNYKPHEVWAWAKDMPFIKEASRGLFVSLFIARNPECRNLYMYYQSHGEKAKV